MIRNRAAGARPHRSLRSRAVAYGLCSKVVACGHFV
jgi:hypothetical protein